jgi:hypothetical protein
MLEVGIRGISGAYAQMLLPFLKYNLGITMLGHIVLDMIRAGANKNGKGLVIGFMAELSRELSSTILKCITFILRRPTPSLLTVGANTGLCTTQRTRGLMPERVRLERIRSLT